MESPEEAASKAPDLAPVKRVSINQKVQKSFEELGAVISSQVHDLMQGKGIGLTSEFKQYVQFFCNCAKKFDAAIKNNQVLPPESLEGIISLYHLDYNAPASELYPELCTKLLGGIPHIGD